VNTGMAAGGDDEEPSSIPNPPLLSKAEYYDQMASLDMGFTIDNDTYTDRVIMVCVCVCVFLCVCLCGMVGGGGR
jgi:hypothetical protein